MDWGANYLVDADFSAGFQEVVNVPSTSRHGEFRLKVKREHEKEKLEIEGDNSRLLVMERGCCRQIAA
jgi:hypothetical protein